MNKGAVISGCGQFRYHLFRKWDDEPGKHIAFVMLNPSTADAEEDDPTIRKCIGFAQRLGYRGIDVVNLYAYRATKPSDLRAAGYPIGPDGDAWLMLTCHKTVEGGGIVVCAWGQNASKLQRPIDVMRSMRFGRVAVKPHALALCKDGTPAHPLMLPYTCTPQAF